LLKTHAEYIEMEDITHLAEYYGVPDIPVTEFVSVDDLRIHLRCIKEGVNGLSVMVTNVSPADVNEISNDPELGRLKFDYFEEFRAIIVLVTASTPHEYMHGGLDDLLNLKVRQNGINESEYQRRGEGEVWLENGLYCPDSSRESYHQDRDKPNVVIEAGFSQSLESLRAKARDYITGRISAQRTEPDAERLVDLELENHLAVYSVEFLNTRIREEVEHMHDEFEHGVNLVFIISHSENYTNFFVEAWARSFVDRENCLRAGAVQIERRPDEQFAVGILPFGHAGDLAVTPTATWVTDDDGAMPELLIPLVFLIGRNPTGRERDVTLTSTDFQDWAVGLSAGLQRHWGRLERTRVLRMRNRLLAGEASLEGRLS
jgi:hypothetical protein